MNAQHNTPLDQLNSLYEDARDSLSSLQILEEDHAEYSRVYQIIREMRDLAATHIQSRERLIKELEENA